jgi:hypothetical protein
MRRMIVRMIATGSLSAFSSAALPELPSQAARGVGGVQQARSGASQPPVQAAPQLQVPQDQGKLSGPGTGRVPPRGSLLDLSV